MRILRTGACSARTLFRYPKERQGFIPPLEGKKAFLGESDETRVNEPRRWRERGGLETTVGATSSKKSALT